MQADPRVAVLVVVVAGERLLERARASSSEPNLSGKTGVHFNVLNATSLSTINRPTGMEIIEVPDRRVPPRDPVHAPGLLEHALGELAVLTSSEVSQIGDGGPAPDLLDRRRPITQPSAYSAASMSLPARMWNGAPRLTMSTGAGGRRHLQPAVRRLTIQGVDVVDQAVQRRSRDTGHVVHAQIITDIPRPTQPLTRLLR